MFRTDRAGLRGEVPDFIRGRVFAGDWGFVTLTMSISSRVSVVVKMSGPTEALVYR